MPTADRLRFRRSRRSLALVASTLLGAAAVLPATASGAQATTPRTARSAPTSDGVVSGSGVARYFGSPGANTGGTLVGIAGRADGSGYWVARSDGRVFAYGSAPTIAGPSSVSSPVVSIAAHPNGRGYWLLTARGGVAARGEAQHFSQPAAAVAAVAIVPTPTGNGYWIALGDGGVLSYGDAHFRGSAYGFAGLNGGIVSMATTPTGRGYWLLARNGALFAFGDAPALGNPWPSTTPMVAIAATASGGGYVVADSAGRVRTYGDAARGARPTPPANQISSASGRVRWRPSSADATATVSSVSNAIARRTVALSAAYGTHSFWVLNDAMPDATLLASRGSNATVVGVVQRALVARGYWVNTSGVFDDSTQQAMWAFQKITGRSRSGTITAGDYRALLVAGRPSPRSTSGDVAEVDVARQVIFMVRGGRTLWVFNTSTGSEHPYTVDGVTQIAHTPRGRFKILRVQDGMRIGRLGSLWRPRYFTPDGVAFHGNGSVPPYPASHGCARMSNEAIDYVWATGLLPIGSGVWVY